MELNTEDKQFLLKVARDILFSHLTDNDKPVYYKAKKFYEKKMGLFIKVFYKDNLRAYGGVLDPEKGLIDTIQDIMIKACFNDSRFISIKNEEYEEVDIQFALIDSIEDIHDRKLIKPEIHGLLMSFKGKTGVVLPWDFKKISLTPNEYIRESALKVGIDNDRNIQLKIIKVIEIKDQDYTHAS